MADVLGLHLPEFGCGGRGETREVVVERILQAKDFASIAKADSEEVDDAAAKSGANARRFRQLVRNVKRIHHLGRRARLVLMYVRAVPAGTDYGFRETFADMGQTILHHLYLAPMDYRTSMVT